MPVISIEDLADPRVADYRDVPDPVLLRDRGLFVGEGRVVVRMLLADGRLRLRLRSLLVTEAALAAVQDLLPGATGRSPTLPSPDLPLYVCSRAGMGQLIGFNVSRGCLALCERPAPSPLADVLPLGQEDQLVVVLESAANADNVGGVFRNAVAFGADAVLLSPTSCDPLYRKAIRVSVGGTLRMPFAYLPRWPEELGELRRHGYFIVALTPHKTALEIGAIASPDRPAKLALVAGAEGVGLSAKALASADALVRIPMVPGVDSLNLATATGIALHRLSRRC